MKSKPPKRPNPNKHQEQRRLSNASTAVFDTSSISSKKIDLGTGTVHLDSHIACLKSNATLKSQKALKRDLLRCSDQRPSLLGPQTLQPPRIHHGSQQTHTASSSSNNRQQPGRRHSLSVNSRTFYATIDRIGPWPDVSISRLRSDGNELLRPLKNFRNLKNPRVFSPKYYAALNDDTSKFKFYSQTRNYIDEYRKQKGYLTGARPTPEKTYMPVPTSVIVQETEEDQYSAVGEFTSGDGDLYNDFEKDRAFFTTVYPPTPQNEPIKSKSINDLSENINIQPKIPSVTKVLNEPPHTNNVPAITQRNGHVRPTRHPPHHPSVSQQPQHQQAIVLPSLTASSLHYISSMSSVEKAYANSKKALSPSQSKLFLIDGRHKKRYIYKYLFDLEHINLFF